MQLYAQTGRCKPAFSINLNYPLVMIRVEKDLGYDDAVRVLLSQAEAGNQEPLILFGDGKPATYLGTAEAGVIEPEEVTILVMPTKWKELA